jgi:large subunit ribosomal protein L19
MADEKKTSEAAEVQAQGTDEDQKNTANKGENIVEAKGEQGHGAVYNPKDLSFLSEMRTDLPDIRPGMQLRVFYRVIEGGKERTQVFEGTVIAIKNSGISKTITVRKTSFGIAVERIFPLNSKLVQKIEMKKRQKVRRAKLYYLKNLKGKAARLKELR